MNSHDERELELRLRRVLQEEAATMSPDPNGLEQIRAQANQPAADGGRPGWLWPALAAAAVAAVVIAFVVIPGLGDDDEPAPATSPSPTATSESPTPTSTPSQTSTPTPSPTGPTGGASSEIAPDGLAFVVIDPPLVNGPHATLRGTAMVFEATLNWELRDAGGTVVNSGFVTTTDGAPARGAWQLTLQDLANGDYVFEAYEASAEDGRKLNIATATFTVG